MSAKLLVADGLWKALCPNFSAHLVRKSLQRHIHSPRRARPSCSGQRPRKVQYQCIHARAGANEKEQEGYSAKDTRTRAPRLATEEDTERSELKTPEQDHGRQIQDQGDITFEEPHVLQGAIRRRPPRKDLASVQDGQQDGGWGSLKRNSRGGNAAGNATIEKGLYIPGLGEMRLDRRSSDADAVSAPRSAIEGLPKVWGRLNRKVGTGEKDFLPDIVAMEREGLASLKEPRKADVASGESWQDEHRSNRVDVAMERLRQLFGDTLSLPMTGIPKDPIPEKLPELPNSGTLMTDYTEQHTAVAELQSKERTTLQDEPHRSPAAWVSHRTDRMGEDLVLPKVSGPEAEPKPNTWGHLSKKRISKSQHSADRGTEPHQENMTGKVASCEQVKITRTGGGTERHALKSAKALPSDLRTTSQTNNIDQRRELEEISTQSGDVQSPYAHEKSQPDYLPDEDAFMDNPGVEPKLTQAERDLLQIAGKERLYEVLPSEAAHGHLSLVEQIVYRLVHDLHETPNLAMYAALVLSNVSRSSGSAALAQALVTEMKAEGLVPDASIYNALLQVLAVHPDAIYRGQIIAEMREQWIEVTPLAQHYIAAGHIKELQLEQALEVLDAMLDQNVEPQSWLLNMISYQLCAMGEIDEALRLLQLRANRTSMRKAISPALWATVFDAAAAALHHPALAYIWRRRVELLKFTPSTGQCTQVLHAAARHGDIPLATDVFRALSTRGTTFGREHYELLIDCYARARDIDTALGILCIMQTAGVAPDERTTRPLARALAAEPARVPAAYEALKDLRAARRTIPLAAVNCIIEVTLEAGEAAGPAASAEFGLPAAVEQYKALRILCPAGPNVATFDALLRGCRVARRKDTAMFLAAEMLALGLMPGALTYDRLILVCLEAAAEEGAAQEGAAQESAARDSWKDAMAYYGEMRARELYPRRGTFRLLVETGCARGDEVAWWFVDEMRAAGFDERPTRAWLEARWERS
ncbi:hypothetical protein FH972_021353 [Carpinus fangiana]|uniref:Pentatricopeptide repeat-containing protein-mitochondrial domain-containing protein n=1 Tax=Carpinus fangiana TaxID=176857 RepID=A0A5N6KPP0_9ROSI|nr:hypothetical protein FH972_021353 [Carpinus fangiana]